MTCQNNLRPKDYLYITIFTVMILLIIASLAGCSTVKTAIHKNEETTSIKTNETETLQWLRKDDNAVINLSDSGYEKETVIEYAPATSINGFGASDFNFSSDTSGTLAAPAPEYNTIFYPAAQIKKITIREKGIMHKTQAVTKSSKDSITLATTKKEEVKQEVAVKEKNKQSSRVPVVGLIILFVILVCVFWAWKRYAG